MEVKIQNQISEYFSFFDEFYNNAKESLKVCQNSAVSINKLIKRCNNVKIAVLTGTPLEDFEGLQNRLCASLHNLISEDIEAIRKQLCKIEEFFEKLLNQHKKLTECCREVDFKQKTKLICGSPFQPPLKELLEFADDVVTFGSQICRQIETALEVLAYKGLDAELVIDNFRISSDWRQRIPEIIAYTSFIQENQI